MNTGDGRLGGELLQQFREEKTTFRMRDLVVRLWKEIHVLKVYGREIKRNRREESLGSPPGF